jgi:class 3 adenylate cyclase
MAQPGKIEGERKQITVMFCGMEGFTPLAENSGSEKAYSVMDEIYEIPIYIDHEFEGTVNEPTSDGIMALFGVPNQAIIISYQCGKKNDKLFIILISTTFEGEEYVRFLSKW